MVSFNQIPTNLRTFKFAVELSNELANLGSTLLPVKVLLVGQQLSSGTFTSNVAKRVFNESEVAAGAGYGSILHLMSKRYFQNNNIHDLYILPLDDNGAGVAASGDITFTASSPQSGTIKLYIAGQSVDIPVASTDTSDDIATTAASVINGINDLPVTAAVNGVTANQVDLTAKNKGALGNFIDIRTNYFESDRDVSGVTVAIVAMSGGATDPTVSTALDGIDETWFNYMAFPLSDATSLGELKTWLDERSDAMIAKYCQAFTAADDTVSNLTTLGESHNNQWLSIIAATGIPMTPPEIAGALVGLVAKYHNQSIGSRAVPVQNRELVGILPPEKSDELTQAERNALLYSGISGSVNRLNKTYIDQIITTYKQNDAGAPDWSYLWIETLAVLVYLQYDWNIYALQKYGNKVIGDNNVRYNASNTNVVTLDSLQGDLIARASTWARNNLIENLDDFAESLTVERDELNASRVNFSVQPDIANGLRQLAGKIAFKGV